MADLTDLDRPAYVADYGHPLAMAEALLRKVEPDSPLLAEQADAPDSNSGPSGGGGSTPPQGTIPHRVLSARLRANAIEDIPADVEAIIATNMERAFREQGDRHFHVADLVGDAFYVEGARMKRAICRTCGIDLEDRRA